MPRTPITIDDDREPRARQDISQFAVSSDEIIEMLSMYDPYGIWKIDLESGNVFWSRDVYEIHGLEYHEGAVNLNEAIDAYHPDDAKIVAQLIDETIANKSGYRFVLRLKQRDGTFKMVKSVAKYRVNDEGREEICGLFSEFQLPIRNIATH